MNDVSRPEMGEVRDERWTIYRITLEHSRLLLNIVERAAVVLTLVQRPNFSNVNSGELQKPRVEETT